MPLDILIVGQGLAGSLLAWQALQSNLKVLVVDNGHENASQVAAGLINPLGGLRLLKATDVDFLLPIARATYRQLEQHFGQRFLMDRTMLRLLTSANQRRYADQRCQDSGYRDYLDGWETTPATMTNSWGCLRQVATAYLDTRPLLQAIRHYLIARQAYRRCRFDYAELRLEPELQWQAIKPRWVVFCEGHALRFNPWFAWLPLQPVQGDILTVDYAQALPEHILNFGQWLLPISTHSARIGATFNRQQLDAEPCRNAPVQLQCQVQQWLPGFSHYQVTAHACGIRPATQDKQPFIGCHPRYPSLVVFNGFGAKGSLAIPGYAQQLLAYCLRGEPLSAHVAIERYPCRVLL